MLVLTGVLSAVFFSVLAPLPGAKPCVLATTRREAADRQTTVGPTPWSDNQGPTKAV